MSVNANDLRQFIERIETLGDDKKNIQEQIKYVYAEAVSKGFDASAMREIVKMRKLHLDELSEYQDLIDAYLNALGMLKECK